MFLCLFLFCVFRFVSLLELSRITLFFQFQKYCVRMYSNFYLFSYSQS